MPHEFANAYQMQGAQLVFLRCTHEVGAQMHPLQCPFRL